jgi:hypothetical protein
MQTAWPRFADFSARFLVDDQLMAEDAASNKMDFWAYIKAEMLGLGEIEPNIEPPKTADSNIRNFFRVPFQLESLIALKNQWQTRLLESVVFVAPLYAHL